MDKKTYIENLKKEQLDSFYEYKKQNIKEHRLEQLFLEVTSNCNAKCEHCGSSCGYIRQKDEVSAEDLKKTLKEIADAYDATNILLDVTGGEPLMRKDLFDIMGYADSLGFKWGMTTNGMLITDKVIDNLEKTHMASVSISLDGIGKTHEEFRKVPGCFNKIVENIKKLKTLKDKGTLYVLQVTTVANKKNIKELDELYNLMIDLGVDSWRLITVDPIGRAKDSDDILLDKKEFKYVIDYIIEKNKLDKLEIEYGCAHYLGLNYEKKVRPHYFICEAGINIGSVLSNGDIFVCPNVPRVKELIQGNVKTDSFVDVWENKYKEFRKINRCKSDKCKKCKYWKHCLGDSFHTYDYCNKTQNICIKDIFTDREMNNLKID